MSEQAKSDGFTDQGRKVAAHWSKIVISYDAALEALNAKGISAQAASANDLHAFDMMHMGGLSATDAVASAADVHEGLRVLDVGCGLGGPARRFADKFGANVWGLELSETLFETARKFTALVGLSEKVQFANGSALALPFDDAMFDVVVMQHVAMQISEKDRLFAELSRVIRPGGKLAMHEIFSGDGELLYPLAWASEPSMSALEPFAECTARLSDLGFEVGGFEDHSDDGRQHHETTAKNLREALSKASGGQDLTTWSSTDASVIAGRLKVADAMASNLRTGSLKVGLVVSTKLN
jgi:ubiquinone/menaquinone biosynthesis C-methylase UbiE